MNRYSLVAIIVTFVVGICIQFYLGEFMWGDFISPRIGGIVGAGLALLLMTGIIPIIISLIIYLVNKKFPNIAFTIMMYIMLVIVGNMVYEGTKIQIDERRAKQHQFDSILKGLH